MAGRAARPIRSFPDLAHEPAGRSGTSANASSGARSTIRANELPPDAKEYGDLELYLAVGQCRAQAQRARDQALAHVSEKWLPVFRKRHAPRLNADDHAPRSAADRRRCRRVWIWSTSRAPTAQQRLTQDELLAFDHYGNITLAAHGRPARAADAGLSARAVGERRCRRGEGTAAASDRQGVS